MIADQFLEWLCSHQAETEPQVAFRDGLSDIRSAVVLIRLSG